MWVSRRTDYATRAVLSLSLADEELTLERVVRVFEGQLAPIGYATRYEPDPCPAIVARSLRPAWEEIRDATITILDRINFADLAEAARVEGKHASSRR